MLNELILIGRAKFLSSGKAELGQKYRIFVYKAVLVNGVPEWRHLESYDEYGDSFDALDNARSLAAHYNCNIDYYQTVRNGTEIHNLSVRAMAQLVIQSKKEPNKWQDDTQNFQSSPASANPDRP